MAFDEDMFALIKTDDWQACHRRIDEEEPGTDQKDRFSIAYWRSVVLQHEGQYEAALRVLDGAQREFFSRCAFAYFRAKLLCRIGKFAEAIETLRNAPFGDEIETFPGMSWEAMFLYCYLLIRNGREAPPNLLAAIPDDFETRTYDGKRISKSDLLALAGGSATTSG